MPEVLPRDTKMTRVEFEEWLVKRIKERLAEADCPMHATFTLGEWLDGIEQSGVLEDLNAAPVPPPTLEEVEAAMRAAIEGDS